MDNLPLAVGYTRRNVDFEQIRVLRCLPDNVRFYVVGLLRLVYRAREACVKVGRCVKARRCAFRSHVRFGERVKTSSPVRAVHYRRNLP